ncbi:MAG: deoxyuridine 5'-triphosphate nucleotidohydrolase [Patescibacteria group bacterium]
MTNNFMQVRIKNKSGKALEYKTPGACAFDFESLEDYTFAPGEWKLVDTGTVIATPEGYCLVIAPRSGTFKNYGLMQVNSIGIIDQDYCGDNDTVKFAYINMRKEEVVINK